MGERIYGYHAIEEGLKKAFAGSTLYLMRSGGERLNKLEFKAQCTGKVAVKKVSREELDRMAPDIDHRGAILDLGGPRKGASRLKEVSVDEFLDRAAPPHQGGLDDGLLHLDAHQGAVYRVFLAGGHETHRHEVVVSQQVVLPQHRAVVGVGLGGLRPGGRLESRPGSHAGLPVGQPQQGGGEGQPLVSRHALQEMRYVEPHRLGYMPPVDVIPRHR